MAGTYIGKYDTTAANNTATSTGSVSVAEGMLPSNINNAFRDIMADIRQFYNSAEWIEYGDGAGTYTATYASSTSFTIDGVDVTTPYHAGRRVKLVASSPGTIYGTISSSSFSTNTTVNVSWDSGSLSDEAITSVHIGIISAINTATPESLAITGDYTLDVSGDIILDAGGADVTLKDDGTVYGSLSQSGGELLIKSGTTPTTALTMSGADVTVAGDLTITGDDLTMTTNTSGAALIGDGSNFNPVVISGDISIGTTGTAAIGSGVIVDADINGSAAIDASKIADGSVSDAEFQRLDGLSADIQTQLDAKQATITGSATTIDTESLTATRALISNASQKVAVSDVTETELGYLDGVSSAIQTQMDTKATTTYVDNLVTGLKTRILCEAASTANVTIASALENGDTLDGVTLATGDRVLLKDQSTGSQNGVYTVVASGAASRDTDFNTISELSGQMVIINQGTTNDNTFWLCTTDNDATLDSDSISFSRVTPSNSGTVTSVGLGDAGSSEFTIASTPVTSAGTITIGVNSIGAAKIADGTVSDAEYQRLDGVTSDIQTQLDAKGTMSNFTLSDGSATQTVADSNTMVVAAGEGIDTAVTATDTVTISGEDASTSNKGVASFSSSDFDVSSGAVSIKDNAVTLAYMAGGTDGNIISYDASGDPVAIATGNDGQVLTSAGAGAAPAFEDASGGGTSWQSVVTASTLTAVAGNGYPINTTSNACTVTLPASPSVGDTIEFTDYARNWGRNAVTFNLNSLKYQGQTTPVPVYDTNGESLKIVYIDATQGWIPTNDGAVAWETPQTYNIEYLVVAGAGGGGCGYYGGGGGAGGYLTNTVTYTGGNVLTIAVGAGGAGSSDENIDATNGGDSSITSSGSEATVTSDGGGGGASRESDPASDGGSGGGASRPSNSGGSATAGQGNDGGACDASGYGAGGGGAGAAGNAGAASPNYGADGGDGLQNDIVEANTDVYYAGGGAGGAVASRSGGQGGGGDVDSTVNGGVGGAGTDGLGGGGAGGYGSGTSGGDGGDGIVILRMLTADYTGTVSGNETPTVDGDYTVINFENTAGGSYTI